MVEQERGSGPFRAAAPCLLGGPCKRRLDIGQIARRHGDSHRIEPVGLRKQRARGGAVIGEAAVRGVVRRLQPRSEEHTSELQSLMRISYAVFCLKKKK